MKADAGDIMALGGIAVIGIGIAMMHKPTALIVVGAMYYITAMLPYMRRP